MFAQGSDRVVDYQSEDLEAAMGAHERLKPLCPYCGSSGDRQVRSGIYQGRQRYKCAVCLRRYTLDRKYSALTTEVRATLLGLRRAGFTPPMLAKQLRVDVRTIKSWLAQINDLNPPSTLTHVQTGSHRVVSPPSTAVSDPVAYKRPTMLKVAERAGVSVSTVSNFLNNKRRMSALTQSKIQSAIEALNFRPNALMKAIRENRTGIFSVVLFGRLSLEHNLGCSILPPVLSGLDRGGEESNLDILLCTNWSGSSRISADRFLGGHVDGVLWVAPGLHEPVLDQVAEAGLPVVALLSRHVPANVGYVNVDNSLGIKMAVDHLFGTGRSKIAYFGPIFNSNFLDRRDAFVEAIADHGLSLPVDYLMTPLYLPEHSSSAEDYLLILERLLRSANRPDSVVCADDSLAIKVLDRIKGCGLRCPEDVAVTGFNDVPDASVIGNGITTLRQPFNEMAAAAVHLLKLKIDGDNGQSNRLTIPPTLICRGSTSQVNELR
jgi:LacI family transcriptional regulator